ncbi:MAG: FtsX-like permease family protein [Fimbriimonadaceae bacterium]
MSLRAALTAGIGLVVACLGLGVPTDEEAQAVYRERIDAVDARRIRQSIDDIAAFGSRMPGSEGERRALEYAESRLRELGATNFRREPFRVTVPDPDAVGRLRSSRGDWSADVFPLWPNLVRTSTCDLEGPIIYVGDGSLPAMRGKDMKGAIALMEFRSVANWRQAAKLGARAVVFIEPPSAGRTEFEHKFSAVPIDVPRFWLPIDRSGPVIDAALRGDRVRLSCRQEWVQRETYNLVADLSPGDPGDRRAQAERIMLTAYADSMSVVPKFAPGAESSSGLAVLLELARIIRKFPGRRPVSVTVFAAHSLALQGEREFAERRLQGNEPPLLLVLNLDLTSGSSSIGSHGRGWLYDYRNETLDRVRQGSRTFRQHADRIAPVVKAPAPRMVIVDAANDSDSRPWRNTIPGKFAMGCEPLLLAQINSLSWATVEDLRDRVDTPFDTAEHVDAANLGRQAGTMACLLWHLLNDTSDRSDTSNFRVRIEPRRPGRMSLVGGFATMTGRVVVFDPEKSFIPDVPVPGSLVVFMHEHKSLMGVRASMVAPTVGEQARYRFIGMPTQNTYWVRQQRPLRISAFRLDPATGQVTHAPVSGLMAVGANREFQLRTAVREAPIVVFPCVATGLFDLVDPQELRTLGDPRVLDAASDAEPREYGFFQPGQSMSMTSEVEDAAVLFTPPGLRYKLLMGTGIGDSRLILVNATEDEPLGRGYLSPGRKDVAIEGRDGIALDGVMPMTALQTATDILTVNQSRLDKFVSYKIISPGAVKLQEDAMAELRAAQEAVAAKDWAAAERHARTAWGLGLRAHPVIQGTTNDVVQGVVFYLFLLIPFSYFCERLFFGSRELTKQLGWSAAIFIVAFFVLRMIHPAFEIIGNPAIVFVAFVMGALSLIVAAFITTKFETSLKTLKAEQSGMRELDIGRVSVALAAFNLGLGNMRRRRARTALTTLTLVVMTFIVLSFTSIVNDLTLHELPSRDPARYSGILVRNPGLESLQSATYRTLLNLFETDATVVRRAYYFGANVTDVGAITLSRADRSVDLRAALGVEPGEQYVTRPQEGLIPGGRWFRPGDTKVVILPRTLAERLKIANAEVGKAQVQFAGESYTVIGLIEDSVLRGITDLDGDGILPPDYSLTNRYQTESRTANQAFRKFLRLDPPTTFLMTVEDAFAVGADLRSVAIRFENPAETRQALDALMPRLRMNLYAAVPNRDGNLEIRTFSVLQGVKNTGLGLVLVQMLIAAVFVLNTMIASVFERTKEIGIFSAIGLAPNHIAILFFAESLVYGVLGAVFGYFLAQGAAKFILATGLLPGLYLNFSATSAVLAAAVVMLTVLLSTIYPARVASRIAAPALDEELAHTEPEGDSWRITLPFSVGEAESGPMIWFFHQWFRSYEEFTIGDFVTSETAFAQREQPGGGWSYEASTTAWLAPYDLGVSQKIVLVTSATPLPNVYTVELRLERISGDPANWVNVNRRFLTTIRKQFLAWRILSPQERERFKPGGPEVPGDGPSPEPANA